MFNIACTLLLHLLCYTYYTASLYVGSDSILRREVVIAARDRRISSAPHPISEAASLVHPAYSDPIRSSTSCAECRQKTSVVIRYDSETTESLCDSTRGYHLETSRSYSSTQALFDSFKLQAPRSRSPNVSAGLSKLTTTTVPHATTGAVQKIARSAATCQNGRKPHAIVRATAEPIAIPFSRCDLAFGSGPTAVPCAFGIHRCQRS